MDVDSGEIRDVMHAITNVAFAPPDRLLFVRSGTLMWQSLDLTTITLKGEPAVLAENILAAERNHYYVFSASNTGLLAYKSAPQEAQLTWVDRSGAVLEELEEKGRFGELRLSPSGTRMAFEKLDADGRVGDIWMLDLDRNLTSRLTYHPGEVGGPVWSPDEKRLAYYWAEAGAHVNVYARSLGQPDEKILMPDIGTDAWPQSWNIDGATLLFLRVSSDTASDIWLKKLDGPAAPEAILGSDFWEEEARVSPDGRWLSYVSDETGRGEVSTRGGSFPRWRGDSLELFFQDPAGMISAVTLRPSGEVLEAEAPRKLFRYELPEARSNVTAGFTPDVDGQRFLVRRRDSDPALAPMTIIQNWAVKPEAP